MLVLPIKKKWFDMIKSGEKKKNIERLSPIGLLDLEII